MLVKIHIALFILLVTAVHTSAQTNFVQLSERSKRKIEKAKSPAKKLKRYAKYYSKDSLKQIRRLDRMFDAATDSLENVYQSRLQALERRSRAFKDDVNTKTYNTIYRPWARKQAQGHLQWLEEHSLRLSATLREALLMYLEQYYLDASQNDSLLAAIKRRRPGIKMPKQLAAKAGDYKTLNPEKFRTKALSGVNGKLPSIQDAAQLDHWQGNISEYTSKAQEFSQYKGAAGNSDQVKALLEKQGEAAASKYGSKIDGYGSLLQKNSAISKIKQMPGGYKEKAEQWQDSAALKEQARQKAEELAMEYISQHPEITQGAQRKMQMLMKKYSVIPNSNDLTSAIKRTSLKGKSFKERLYLASNFQLLSMDPLSIDLSPMIGYRLNKKFLVGIGGNYRQSFADTIRTIYPSLIGFKVFSSYDILANFFAYGEFDRNSPRARNQESPSRPIWKNAAFIGIGRRFKVLPKLEMSIITMYNFLHETNDPIYPRSWTVKIGFQTNALAFFKPKN